MFQSFKYDLIVTRISDVQLGDNKVVRYNSEPPGLLNGVINFPEYKTKIE